MSKSTVVKRAGRHLVAWCVSWFCIGLIGCDGFQRRPSRAMPDEGQEMSVDVGQDHLDLAFDFLEEFHKYDQREITSKVNYHLQEWLSAQEPDDDWLADPLFGKLPRNINIDRRQTTLSRLQFADADIVMLREAIWLNEIAKQIAPRQLHDARLAAWLDTTDIPSAGKRDLSKAIEVFDWVLRNIQQESFALGREMAQLSQVPPPPDGAARNVWEAIQIGRGDWLVRSRAMILIARQLNVPMVMLAVDRDDRYQPWLVAAIIEKQLYLFDTKLGLPVPGPEGKGIATLAEVLDAPELLDTLTLGDGKYRLAESDLNRLVALVDGSPSYLSQRMKLLEKQLTGDRKLTLSVAPSPLARELRKLKGITNVAIWPLPYEVVDYRMSHRDTQLLLRLDASVRPFFGQSALAFGRRKHIKGEFSSLRPARGAKAYYLMCRVPDAQINRPVFTDEIFSILGLKGPLPESPEEQRNLAAYQVATLRFFKQHASYYLGLIALEQGQYKVAADYFDKRTLQAYPDGPFTDGARYNLARAYEAIGDASGDLQWYRKAIEIYKADESPQKLGNRIRAQRLQERL